MRSRFRVEPDLVDEWCQVGGEEEEEEVVGEKIANSEGSVRELLDKKTVPDLRGR